MTRLTIGRTYRGHDGTRRRLRARWRHLVQWCDPARYRRDRVVPGHTATMADFVAWMGTE